MTPKPPSERDVEMATEACDLYIHNHISDYAHIDQVARLLAQAREEGRLEGIEQAANASRARLERVAGAQEAGIFLTGRDLARHDAFEEAAKLLEDRHDQEFSNPHAVDWSLADAAQRIRALAKDGGKP